MKVLTILIFILQIILSHGFASSNLNSFCINSEMSRKARVLKEIIRQGLANEIWPGFKIDPNKVLLHFKSRNKKIPISCFERPLRDGSKIVSFPRRLELSLRGIDMVQVSRLDQTKKKAALERIDLKEAIVVNLNDYEWHSGSANEVSIEIYQDIVDWGFQYFIQGIGQFSKGVSKYWPKFRNGVISEDLVHYPDGYLENHCYRRSKKMKRVARKEFELLAKSIQLALKRKKAHAWKVASQFIKKRKQRRRLQNTELYKGINCRTYENDMESFQGPSYFVEMMVLKKLGNRFGANLLLESELIFPFRSNDSWGHQFVGLYDQLGGMQLFLLRLLLDKKKFDSDLIKMKFFASEYGKRWSVFSLLKFYHSGSLQK